jgi:PAS domain S-box-containing protein
LQIVVIAQGHEPCLEETDGRATTPMGEVSRSSAANAALVGDRRALDLATSAGTSSDRNALVLGSLCLAVAYYLGAKLGLALTFRPHPISVLWPPNSLLLAALLLTAPRFWWVLILAALPAHLAAELQSGVPPAMVLGWFVSNCSEALIGAVCIRRLVDGPLHFDSFRHVGVFLIGAVVLAPLLSSFLDAAFVKLVGWGEDSYWRLWRLRFFSNVLAEMTLVPVIVTWATGGLAWLRKGRFRSHLELGLLLVGLLTVGSVVFDQQEAGPSTTPALFYVPLPFLLWAAVRLGPLGTSTALLTMVLLAIWGAIHGQGPFVTSSPEENARSVQLFLIAVGLPMLLLAAVVEEQRKAKEALQLSEERSAKIFRSNPDAIAIVRRSDGAILDVNERWESMFGFSRAEAVGHSTLELKLYVDDRDRQAVIHLLAKTRGHVRDFATEVRDRTGRVRSAMLTAETVEVSGESCVITLLRDVTEQRRAEHEAQEQREQLMHLSRVAMLGELSGALAHELNQPLTAILSNAQAAQRFLAAGRFDPEELGEILQDIADEDRRAGEVIRRLRALLKKEEAQLRRLEVYELVREVLELARSDLIARNIEIDLRLSPDLPAVRGDLVQLQQVLLNLVVNACDAMSADESVVRTLTIQAERAANSVQLSIADHGPRILPDQMEKLFQPFFTTKQHGLGLGLSISRWIVTAHGGRIWATANPDGGATFHVVLPAHVGAQA